MANQSFIDPISGFSSKTKIFYSLRPSIALPTETPLSFPSYAFSRLPSPLPEEPAFIDAATGVRIFYPEFIRKVQTLASNLQSQIGLSKGDAAFILSPTSLNIPILYFSLLSIGAIASPANPISTPSEISHEFYLSRPTIAFTTSSLADKLPPIRKIILDSSDFNDLMNTGIATPHKSEIIKQSDPAAILYSSGTTGKVKGVVLSHRNFIALVAGYTSGFRQVDYHPVTLITLPLFHIFGFFTCLRLAVGQTAVYMERFEFRAMLQAIHKYRVSQTPVTPPLVVALVKSEEVKNYDLSSLKIVACGGAPLGRNVAEQFGARFPGVEIVQLLEAFNDSLLSNYK